MDEVAFAVSDADNACENASTMRSRPSTARRPATSTADCCASLPAKTAVTCAPGCSGGRGVGAVTSTCSGCGLTSAGPACGRLLATAEEEIARRGCDQVVLSTHSFQAPGFYARFGYEECGRARGYPRGHDHIYLVKSLVAGRKHIARELVQRLGEAALALASRCGGEVLDELGLPVSCPDDLLPRLSRGSRAERRPRPARVTWYLS